ncbi:MAG: UbiA family prenyltransferase [Planctomycetota bacterium]
MNLRAVLELMRVSNLPTVWSNVVLGVMAGIIVGVSDGRVAGVYRESADFSEHGVTSVFNALLMGMAFALPISAFYCGGMVLNDYWDRAIDAQERPGRPIPSGRISPQLARGLAVLLFVVGLLYLLPIQLTAAFREDAGVADGWVSLAASVLLVGVILAYNRVHSRTALSVLLMASCRVLAVLVIALLFAPGPAGAAWWLFVFAPALTLGVYTVMISIIARREVEPGGLGGPKTVTNMIAAMPVLDAAWLAVMGLWPASVVCLVFAGLTKLGHRKIAGS